MEPLSICLSPLPTQRSSSEPDLVLCSDNSLITTSLQHLLLAQFPSLRVSVVRTASAASTIIGSSTSTRLIVALSEGSVETLAEFRTLLRLQRQKSLLRLMILSDYVSNGLQALLPSARWLSLRAPTEQVFHDIHIWLTSPAPLRLPVPLSQLTTRQYVVLLMLAKGQSLNDVASELGISVKTVEAHRLDIQARLGICSRNDWLLLCAVIAGLAPNSVIECQATGSDSRQPLKPTHLIK